MLAMISRLRQATVLPSMLTTESIPSGKLDRAEGLVEQLVNNGEKVVVFSTFKQPVYELASRLVAYNCVVATGDCKDADVEYAIDQFQNNPDVKVFLGTWSKCGTGITLTSASYMIFLDTPWTDAVWTQAQDRIYRIGSKNPVFIYNLVAKGTVDERVLEIVTDKKHIASYIIDDEITDAGIESLRKYIEELAFFS
jgi:SNF2 family DNA or RNA helicase